VRGSLRSCGSCRTGGQLFERSLRSLYRSSDGVRGRSKNTHLRVRPTAVTAEGQSQVSKPTQNGPTRASRQTSAPSRALLGILRERAREGGRGKKWPRSRVLVTDTRPWPPNLLGLIVLVVSYCSRPTTMPASPLTEPLAWRGVRRSFACRFRDDCRLGLPRPVRGSRDRGAAVRACVGLLPPP
jgi:hypothetical protein